MADLAPQDPDLQVDSGPVVSSLPVDHQVAELSSLLTQLDEAPDDTVAETIENRLAEVRLGIASSLFVALRCKHSPTAAHSLRVALRCSAWSMALELDDSVTSELEVAALLHDIGKIAVPDAVLHKPASLVTNELQLMDVHRQAGLKILNGCCSSPAVLEIVKLSPAWYDGSRQNYPIAQRDIPLGARMLSIVDAFDSMTTPQVYRGAMSHERALSELFGFAGTQFDPDLVELFSELQYADQLDSLVTARWLNQLKPEDANNLWQLASNTSEPANVVAAGMFQQRLLENMHDAVLFVDRGGKLITWNRGAERLTGIAATAVLQQSWSPTLIELRDENGTPITHSGCPIAYAMQTCVQSLRRFQIRGRQGQRAAVDIHVVPVLGADGTAHGAAVLLHDASPEASLEQRCQSLHERATKDPLTQVANRAEFDRTHQLFVAAHLERHLPCSLIICDIDHFKRINDTFGHQAGDEALKSFAQLLKSSCRPGDLVARYGGEEFVMLCADCTNATAAERADEMRRAIANRAQPVLDGKSITVSFGVTEIQPGDTTDTMLRRADRALLEAKQRGRNTVVQLGGGCGELEEPPQRKSWFSRSPAPSLVLEKWLVSTVPLKMVIEKIRGFVADHYAEITSIEGDTLKLKLDSGRAGFLKRASDRAIPLVLELRLAEERWEQSAGEHLNVGRVSRTRVYVAIRPLRDRDRRRQNLAGCVKQVAASLKSYLMANEEPAPPAGSLRRATNLLIPWLRKR